MADTYFASMAKAEAALAIFYGIGVLLAGFWRRWGVAVSAAAASALALSHGIALAGLREAKAMVTYSEWAKGEGGGRRTAANRARCSAAPNPAPVGLRRYPTSPGRWR